MYKKEERKWEEYNENPPSAERRGRFLRIVVFPAIIISPGNSWWIPIWWWTRGCLIRLGVTHAMMLLWSSEDSLPPHPLPPFRARVWMARGEGWDYPQASHCKKSQRRTLHKSHLNWKIHFDKTFSLPFKICVMWLLLNYPVRQSTSVLKYMPCLIEDHFDFKHLNLLVALCEILENSLLLNLHKTDCSGAHKLSYFCPLSWWTVHL